MTFFMVGFVLIELFFPKIIFRIKFPLYIVSSLVASTFLIYTLALLFGLSRSLVLVTFTFFLPLSIFFIYKLRQDFLNYFKFNFSALLLCLFVVLLYFLALNPAILGHKDDYLVMSSVNWQDTALHLSITQSLTQGNFPPQAPYFSGAPLSYYYFSDLHSAIIALSYGQFFPRVFVYDNALLAGVFALCLYSLAYQVSKNRKLSSISAFMGSFYGSFIFVKFFEEILNKQSILDILANNIYSMEYQQLFGMANMTDYYLQNRPMMLGLPIVIVSVLLILYAFKKEKLSLFFLAGILSASLIKIQFFCVLAVVITFIIKSLSFLRKTKFKFLLKSYLYFLIPTLVFYFVFGIKSVNGANLINIITNSFHFGPWSDNRTVAWYAKFVILNLGLPFIIILLSLFVGFKKNIKLISILALIFTTIPFLVTFTIDGSDMFKFFYFAIIFFVVITPLVLRKIIKNNPIFNLLITLIVFTTTFASILTLGNSFFNKNLGYSLHDYEVGLWIRNNTPQKSVFVTMPTIHCSPTDFGGRLRVISYTNWPYTHGFNTGDDNVFSRANDVENVFKTGDIAWVKLKYNANYIYYGEDEKSAHPESGTLFDRNKNLKKIYSQDNIDIYEIL